MHKYAPHVPTANQYAIASYLGQNVFTRIDMLLRSTRTERPNSPNHPKLHALVHEYMKQQEDRLRCKLLLDTRLTVTLVTGSGRIERVG
jgi:hypothetical protein